MSNVAQYTLTRISERFASQLVELTEAIAHGENIDHRLAVLREYARTWMSVAEATARVPVNTMAFRR
jgi:hypothetical protein